MLIKSASTITAALAKGVPCKLYDGQGLVLDIRSKTSASWVFKFQWGGKGDEVGLGPLKKVGLKEAREMREVCLKQVGARKNPREERRKEKQAIVQKALAPKAANIGQLVRDNIELIAKDAKSPRQQKAWIDSLQEGRIGVIAKKLPEEVTDLDAIRLMKDYYKKAPVMADDVRQRMFRVLTWAVKTPGYQNPFRWEGHLEDQVKRKTGDAERNHPSLPHDQVGAFMASLRGENERVTMALALQWLILSATRAKETCFADWSEIDWGAKCWVIPASRMKMRREHAVPLTDDHHAILLKLKPVGCAEFPASGPIFSISGAEGVSVTGLRKFLNSRTDAEGKPYMDPVQGKQITLHGFRTSFRTWGEEQLLPDGSDHRYSEKLLETCLAHAVGSKTRRAYVRSAQVEVRRQIMGAWAGYTSVVQSAKAPAPRQWAA